MSEANLEAPPTWAVATRKLVLEGERGGWFLRHSDTLLAK